jgi:hypothetical protein
MLAGKEIAKVSSQAASCTPTVQEFRIQSDAGDAYTIGIPLVWTNVKRKRHGFRRIRLRDHDEGLWRCLRGEVSGVTGKGVVVVEAALQSIFLGLPTRTGLPKCLIEWTPI